jgi:hypothetical protein
MRRSVLTIFTGMFIFVVTCADRSMHARAQGNGINGVQYPSASHPLNTRMTS